MLLKLKVQVTVALTFTYGFLEALCKVWQETDRFEVTSNLTFLYFRYKRLKKSSFSLARKYLPVPCFVIHSLPQEATVTQLPTD